MWHILWHCYIYSANTPKSQNITANPKFHNEVPWMTWRAYDQIRVVFNCCHGHWGIILTLTSPRDGKGYWSKDLWKKADCNGWRLGTSISKTMGLVALSGPAVVSTHAKGMKDCKIIITRHSVRRPRVIKKKGRQRLSRLAKQNWRQTVVQLTA